MMSTRACVMKRPFNAPYWSLQNCSPKLHFQLSHKSLVKNSVNSLSVNIEVCGPTKHQNLCTRPISKSKINEQQNALLLPITMPNVGHSFSRLFVSWNIRSHEQMNFHSLDHSFPGLFVPWNFRSREQINPANLSLHRPFIPWTVHSLELRSRYPEPFLPLTICSFVSRAVPGPLTMKEQRNKQKHRPVTATVHSRYIQTPTEGV